MLFPETHVSSLKLLPLPRVTEALMPNFGDNSSKPLTSPLLAMFALVQNSRQLWEALMRGMAAGDVDAEDAEDDSNSDADPDCFEDSNWTG